MRLSNLIIIGTVLVMVACQNHRKVVEPEVICIDQDWLFTLSDSLLDAGSQAFDDSGWQLVDLPHDWSVDDTVRRNNPSGEAGGFFGGGIGWYRKYLELPEGSSNKSVQLTFDGIYMNSDIYINGQRIGGRSNGYITQHYDITRYLKPESSNVIAVRVDNSVQPFDRWYTGCGVYRHVWLTITDKLRFVKDGMFVTTPEITEDSASVVIQMEVENTAENAREFTIHTDVLLNSGHIVAGTTEEHTLQSRERKIIFTRLNVTKPKCWSPDHPYLYKAVSTIMQECKSADMVVTPFGIRKVAFSADSGFILNGRKTMLKGVCLHHDLGATGAAFFDKIMLRRLRMFKEMGCNAVRLSHNPYSPQVLDMCDSLGLLVFAEAFDRWEARVDRGRSKAVPFKDSWKDDLGDFIRRDRNHPSVFIWSVGNETYEQQIKSPRGIEIIKELAAFVRETDPTRPVTAAMHPGFLTDPEQFEIVNHTDVASYNYSTRMFAGWRKQDSTKIFMSSETRPYTDYGPLELGPDPDFSGNSWNCLTKADCGQFIWTGIDYLGESPGWPFRGFPWSPVNTCGYRKANAWYVQSNYTTEPMVQLVVFDNELSDSLIQYQSWSKRWTGPPFSAHWNPQADEGDTVSVLTFTNCREVTLTLNGRTIGQKSRADFSDGVIRWKIPYSKGELFARGLTNGKVLCQNQLVSSVEPYKLRSVCSDKYIALGTADIAIVDVEVVDRKGIRCPYANVPVFFKLDGPATIQAVDNGDLSQHFGFQSSEINTHEGRCQVIVRTTGEKGVVKLMVSSEGLLPVTVTVPVY